MTSLDQFKTTYFQECEELLATCEAHLRELKASPASRDVLDAAFRAVHSIKGGAAMFRFERMVGLSHAIETVLEVSRESRTLLTGRVVDKLLLAIDRLSDLATAARSGGDAPADLETSVIDALTSIAIGAGRPFTTRPDVVGSTRDTALLPAPIQYRIRFEPSPELMRRGLEPLTIVRNLRAIGTVTVAADLSDLPAFADLDPAMLYLRWTFYLATALPRHTVVEVFDFAAGCAVIDIEEVPTPPPLPEFSRRAGEDADSKDRRAPGGERRVGSIRVDLPRVERLVDLVGEITIAQAMVIQHLDQSLVTQNPQLFRALTDLLKLSRTLQDSVMAIRAQPIHTIFARMHRIARDGALQLGRDVEIITRGQSTELDKTTVEQLADPLMHIVRNAVFHGIEPPDVRLAAGKPAQGTIILSAQQRGSRIIVEVADDGAGIDRPAVLSRAVAMGIVDAADEISDAHIDSLILSPGLSTAKSVSDIAGRGVGMDVVHQNIRKLGGQIAIRSVPGCGTTTTITLPMTLAVLDAMKVQSAGETYLIPMGHIVECLVIERHDIRHVPGSCDVINVRGKQVRVIELAERFGLNARLETRRVAVVLTEVDEGSVIGLIVDEVSGHQQIVVKTLRDPSLAAAGFAGGTILGDGNVALILDVNQLAKSDTVAASRTPRSMRLSDTQEHAA